MIQAIAPCIVVSADSLLRRVAYDEGLRSKIYWTAKQTLQEGAKLWLPRRAATILEIIQRLESEGYELYTVDVQIYIMRRKRD